MRWPWISSAPTFHEKIKNCLPLRTLIAFAISSCPQSLTLLSCVRLMPPKSYSALPTKQASSSSTCPPTPPRLIQQPLPQKLLIPHLIRLHKSRIELRFLPAKRQQRRHTRNLPSLAQTPGQVPSPHTYPKLYRQIPNPRRIHLDLDETQSALPFSYLFVLYHAQYIRLDGLARKAMAR